jgi:hypothetical protein
MSDHFLVVIPADPKAELPTSADALRDALAGIAGTDEARVKDYGKLQFIDCGENFEWIICPDCRAEITVEQWRAWIDQDWHGEEGFHLHQHETHCCSARVTLNDLVYEWPQGFARWFVGARNEGRGPLSAEELEALEAVAGMPLKAIAQMY